MRRNYIAMLDSSRAKIEGKARRGGGIYRFPAPPPRAMLDPAPEMLDDLFVMSAEVPIFRNRNIEVG